jgi:hypothetical protein
LDTFIGCLKYLGYDIDLHRIGIFTGNNIKDFVKYLWNEKNWLDYFM